MWSDSELLAFLNPDKSLIVIIENKAEAAKTTNLQIGGNQMTVQLQTNSFNTFKADNAN
jgi:O-glycosyl hydrolase